MSYAVSRVAQHYPTLANETIRARLAYSTYVNPERGYLYFEVPKAACTSMKWLIHSLEQLPPIRPFVGNIRGVRRDMFVHARKQFRMPSLVDLDDKTQERVLTDPAFLRFTVVRNPYTRLVSAWFDKVQMCHPGYEYVHRALGRTPNPHRPLPLSEFVRYLGSIDLTQCDHHWRLQSEHLFLRAIDFNLVGRLEHLNEAVAKFCEHTGFAIPPREAKNASSAPNVELEENLALEISRLYEPDFLALGYSPNDLARSSRDTTDSDGLLEELRERNIVISQLYNKISRLQNPPKLAGRPKIFNLSLHRSGTQSVTQFLKDHGVQATHWPGYEFEDQCQPYLAENNSGAVWSDVAPRIKDADAFSDVPFNFMYREALKGYPNAKFFIVLRSPNDWLRSVRRHVGKREMYPLEKLQYWMFAKDKKPALADYSDEDLRRLYHDHLMTVTNYMVAHSANFRLFYLESETIGQDLCDFLGLKQMAPFPHRDWGKPDGSNVIAIR